jgi:hypothetical protein
MGHVRFTPQSGPPYIRALRSRSIRLEIDGFDHAPPFDDVGSKHRVGSFLIKVEGFKAELLETRGHFWQEKSGPCRCDEASRRKSERRAGWPCASRWQLQDLAEPRP